MNPNQQAMQMGGGHMRPQMPMQANLNSLSPADRAKVVQLALSRLNGTPEAQRNQLRAVLQQKMPPQQLAQFQSEGTDPLLYFFQNDILRRGHANAAIGNNQAAMQAQAQAQAQAQRQMNASAQQLAGAGNGEFGPFHENIMNQQKAGLLAQEAGQMVVPASNGPGRNATPQPIGGMPGPNTGNHMGPNQNNVHGISPFNLTQAQQMKMDQRASQSQAQIRAQAQAKQMQGQPGALNGAGGMSQSPGMNTLNTPVRRTPVGMGQGEGQPQMGQPNGPFGQGLDPRFNQGNPRAQMGGNPVNPAMFNPQMLGQQMLNQQMVNTIVAQMPNEARAVFLSLPPDKRGEMLIKYTAANRAQMAGRGQPQPGQFGQVNPMAQFSPGNAVGQQPNPAMQMNRNQMPMQQRMPGMSNNMQAQNRQPIPPDHKAFMDTMDIPPRIIEQMRGSQNPPPPPEVKKWGQLKQWLSQKNISQQFLNNLQQFQMAQYQSLLKQQNAAAGNQMPQAGMPQQGPQPPNGPMPAQPAANMAQFPNVVVTPQEIQAAKNHEKFKTMPDEHIKRALQHMKVQNALRQRAASAQQMQGGQMQTPQTSQPANNNMAPTSQPPNTPGVLQQRPQNTGPDANGMGPGSTPRNVRQPQPNRPPQNAPSAAPQQQKSLKRPSTDDVVEVPNPSTTPIQRPPSQQASASRPGQQAPQWNAPLTSLPQEQRNKLEAAKNRQTAGAGAAGGANAQPQQMSGEMQRLKAIGQDEHNIAAKEPFHEIPMTPEQYNEMARRIQSMVQEMSKLSKILGRWYTLTGDDVRARMFFKTVCIFFLFERPS